MQHDLNIANQGFPAFRADLNDALVALGSTNSGATAPATPYANQLWYDTANNILKIRNEDNDAWISLLTLNQTADSVSEISTAIATLGAGSASNPALTTAGDANTGIFFPAADTIAFAEGGVEIMRITSSGDIGIGTNSPAQKLSVSVNSDSALGSIVKNSNAGTSAASRLILGNDTDDGAGLIRASSANTTFGANALIIYQNLTAPVTFWTNNSERMRIDSSGSVGIGTTPSAWSGSGAKVLQNDRLSLAGISGNSYFSNNWYTDGSSNRYIASAAATQIRMADDTMIFNRAASGTAGASFSWSESMRIDSSGNLLVGTTSISRRLAVDTAATAANNETYYFRNTAASGWDSSLSIGAVVFSGGSPNNTTNRFVYYGDSAGERASFRSNGGLANFSGNNVNLSDVREKTHIELAGSYLDKICSIPVKTFNYIDQNLEEDGGLTLGVIAQDVEAVAPELVMESDWSVERDGSKMRLSIYQTDLQYALMKCIQELKAELDSVKAELQTLKGN